jgi:hypothetical protein
MKKVRLSIEETLRFQRQMIIEIPDDMTEDKLNNILDKAQRKAQSSSDLPFIIEDLNDQISVFQAPDENIDSPWDTDIEIDDFDYINESVLKID